MPLSKGMKLIHFDWFLENKLEIAQLAGAGPGYDFKQSDVEAPVMLEHLFIGITPKSTRTWSGSTWLGSIYGSNRTKLCTYLKLDCSK